MVTLYLARVNLAPDAGSKFAPTKEFPLMADLIVIEFPTEAKAEEVRQKLLSMQQDYIIDIKDAVIAVKQPDGHIKLNQLYHPTAIGAASGASKPVEPPPPGAFPFA